MPAHKPDYKVVWWVFNNFPEVSQSMSDRDKDIGFSKQRDSNPPYVGIRLCDSTLIFMEASL